MKRTLLAMSVFAMLSVPAIAGIDISTLNTEVKLISSGLGNYGCSSCGKIEGTIAVKNLGADKTIIVWIENPETKKWENLTPNGLLFPRMISGTLFPHINYVRELGNGYEEWSFAADGPRFVYAPAKIAIEYKVNGRSYWDSNCGRTYLMNGYGSKVEGQICE